MTKKPLVCSICGGNIEVKPHWAYGNNAEPINDGRCCDDCDATVVIPERLRRIFAAEKKGN